MRRRLLYTKLGANVKKIIVLSGVWRREDRQKLLDILKSNPESYEIEYYRIFAGL
jgi:hypothetical protein